MVSGSTLLVSLRDVEVRNDEQTVRFRKLVSGLPARAALYENLAVGQTSGTGLSGESRCACHPFRYPFHAAVGDFHADLADRAGRPAGPAIATALFACSLPMQGLWWLGRRSVTPLPPTLLQWFHEVRNKLTEAGQAVAPLEGTPTYQTLADLLKRAFKQLDKTFLDDL